MQRNPCGTVDHEALAGALRALGMLYGAKQPVAATTAGLDDESEAIRAYIRRERPHLLSCYDMEALVALVRAARAANAEQAPVVEQFSPV